MACTVGKLCSFDHGYKRIPHKTYTCYSAHSVEIILYARPWRISASTPVQAGSAGAIDLFFLRKLQGSARARARACDVSSLSSQQQEFP